MAYSDHRKSPFIPNPTKWSEKRSRRVNMMEPLSFPTQSERCSRSFGSTESLLDVFSVLGVFFFFNNIKNTSVPVTQPLPGIHSSEKQASLNGDKISMFRSCKRLRWEVLQAVKMDRFHHFLHTNYHTLGASALPLFFPASMLHYL